MPPVRTVSSTAFESRAQAEYSTPAFGRTLSYRGMSGPANAPQRLVRTRLPQPFIEGGLIDYEIGDRDERVLPVKQRNAAAHPRHDALVLKPVLQRSGMCIPGRPESLTAAPEANVESLSRP